MQFRVLKNLFYALFVEKNIECYPIEKWRSQVQFTWHIIQLGKQANKEQYISRCTKRRHWYGVKTVWNETVMHWLSFLLVTVRVVLFVAVRIKCVYATSQVYLAMNDNEYTRAMVHYQILCITRKKLKKNVFCTMIIWLFPCRMKNLVVTIACVNTRYHS